MIIIYNYYPWGDPAGSSGDLGQIQAVGQERGPVLGYGGGGQVFNLVTYIVGTSDFDALMSGIKI